VALIKVKSQTKHFITPKRVTSLRGARLQDIAPRQYSFLGRCWSGDKPFANCVRFGRSGIWTPDLPRTIVICALTAW